MLIRTWSFGEITIVDVSGRLDVQSAAGAPLVAAVGDVLTRGSRDLVLNLRDVPLVDAAGLGQLATVCRAVHAARGELRLVIRPEVRELLTRTHLLGPIHAFYTEAEAIVSLDPQLSH